MTPPGVENRLVVSPSPLISANRIIISEIKEACDGPKIMPPNLMEETWRLLVVENRI